MTGGREARQAVVTPWAFFRVVPLHSGFMLSTLAAAGVCAVGVLLVDPRAGGRACVPVVCLQMFAASTGFVVPARRGHFDLLLTGGSSRIRIGLWHLGMSTVPGLAVWLSVALVELALSGGQAARALAPGTLVAMALVSGLAWSSTVRLPRLSGGLGWLLLMLLVAVAAPRGPDMAWPLDAGRGAAAAIAFVACPILLVGRLFDTADLWLLAPSMLAGAGSVAAALLWIVRTDIALEAAQ